MECTYMYMHIVKYMYMYMLQEYINHIQCT